MRRHNLELHVCNFLCRGLRRGSHSRFRRNACLDSLIGLGVVTRVCAICCLFETSRAHTAPSPVYVVALYARGMHRARLYPAQRIRAWHRSPDRQDRQSCQQRVRCTPGAVSSLATAGEKHHGSGPDDGATERDARRSSRRGGRFLARGAGVVAYAFPTQQGSAPKRDVPTSERDRIEALVRATLSQAKPVVDLLHGSRETVVLKACGVMPRASTPSRL